ncbi:hypothetical protein UCRPC4_g04164 [Phaeomoniella chlamydospora]|uniref:Apple domain-containing protein n=1 Tax=Phaeomoniella chlamydospora TaxID=158046 RepID=A0A0G2EC01_PHACM|nr:hypothetical protein UCRPC4_g04164 [Phaeomoniella chlamydospora]
MHFSFSSVASAITVSSLVLSASAGVVNRGQIPAIPELIKRHYYDSPQYCTVDDILGPLTSYLPITLDATSFCSTYISIANTTSYVATTTPCKTVYATTTVVATTTDTVTEYGATSTATVTETAAVLKRDANAAPSPAPTPGPDRRLMVRKILEARHKVNGLSPKQESMLQVIGLELESACSCLNIPELTVYETSTAPTSTRTEKVIGRMTAKKHHTKHHPGPIYVTVTVTETESIIPPQSLTAYSFTATSSSSSGIISGEVTTTYNSSSASTSSLFTSFSSTSSHASLSLLPTSRFANSSGISGTGTDTFVSTPTSSTGYIHHHHHRHNKTTTIAGQTTVVTVTAQPSSTACPMTNGAKLACEDSCTEYVVQCETDYLVQDEYIYGLPQAVDTFGACQTLCDNSQGCVGFVYDLTASSGENNCYRLSSTEDAIYGVTGFVAAVKKNTCTTSSSPSGRPTTVYGNSSVPHPTFPTSHRSGTGILLPTSRFSSPSGSPTPYGNGSSSTPSGTGIISGTYSVTYNSTSTTHSATGTLLPTSMLSSPSGSPTPYGNGTTSAPSGTGTGAISGTYTVTYNSTSSTPFETGTGTGLPTSIISSPSGAPTPYGNTSSSAPSGTGTGAISGTYTVTYNSTSSTPFATGTGTGLPTSIFSSPSGTPAPYSNSTSSAPSGTGVVSGTYTVTYNSTSSYPSETGTGTSGFPTSYNSTISPSATPTPYSNSSDYFPTGTGTDTGVVSGTVTVTYNSTSSTRTGTGALLPTFTSLPGGGSCPVCSTTATVTYTASFYQTVIVTETQYGSSTPTYASKAGEKGGKVKAKPESNKNKENKKSKGKGKALHKIKID